MTGERVRMPGVVDRHVHLGLVDHGALADSAVVEVHDLGWIPDQARRWQRDGAGRAEVRIAGPFVTTPGGYPKGRSWAPDGAVREVADVAQARSAVVAAVVQRFDLLKVVLHADSPPYAPHVLQALVGGAREAGLRVVAHVEGPGQAQLALEAGVDALAHVPWTECLDDGLVAAMAASTTWISTLALHDGEARRTALSNARRFHAAGGRLRYGTDMGNGSWPVGVRREEVLALGEAGLSGGALVEALTGWIGGAVDDVRAVVLDRPVPEDAVGIADWFVSARRAVPDPGLLASSSPQERAAALDDTDPLAPLRRRFLLPEEVVAYLDGNSLGRPLEHTGSRLAQFAFQRWGRRLIRGWDEGWMQEPERLGDELGRVALGAAPGQTVIGDSTTVLLYKAIRAALAARADRDEIVFAAADFPTDRFLLQGIAAETGARLVPLAAPHDGGVTPEQVAAAVGERTAAVVLSHVAYRSAAITDLAAATAAAHAAGALTVWDLSHSVGAVPLHLDAWDADLAVGCTYKYLNGGPGSPAFLYARRSLQPQLRQPVQGWMGAADVFSMGERYEPDPGIRRFLSGTPPILAMVPLADMLTLVDEAGLPAVRAKSERLTAFVVEYHDAELAGLGVRLASPREPERRGSHITLDHPRFAEIVPALQRRGVIPDFRGPDGLRVGLSPLSTSFTELLAGLEAVREELLARA